MFVKMINVHIACNMFLCYINILCSIANMFPWLTKLRTHSETHGAHSLSLVVTFSKMHSNCIAHNAIKFNYSYYCAKKIQAMAQPQTWHHFVFLCPPSRQSPTLLHKRRLMSIFTCMITLRPQTPTLHYTTLILVLSIWWEPIFNVIIDDPLPYNMFSIVVDCAFSLHNHDTTHPQNKIK